MALSVGWSVGLQNILKNSKSRLGEYVAVFCTLINTLIIIILQGVPKKGGFFDFSNIGDMASISLDNK